MVYGDAKKALAIALATKRLLNVEVKNHDVQTSALNVTTTPVVLQITNIAQGDSTNQRDGSQCKVTQLELRFQVLLNGSSTRSSFRLMVVCDKQTNQAVYTAADVLQDITSTDMIVSPINLDNKHRFQIIDDIITHVGDGGDGRIKQFKKFYNMSKIIRFDNAAGAITSLTQSSLSLLFVSTEGTNGPLIQLFSRIRYIDN